MNTNIPTLQVNELVNLDLQTLIELSDVADRIIIREFRFTKKVKPADKHNLEAIEQAISYKQL